MNQTPDGQYQTYTVETGAYIREHFFGGDPRLRRMVEDMSDDDLRRLPLHELKLAGSFAAGLQSPSGLVDQRIVAALVDLAHALGLTVTAEGIETRAQFGRFCAAGCDTGQGALLASAGAPEQVDDLLQVFHPLCDVSTEA